jgi:hypothetical protein
MAGKQLPIYTYGRKHSMSSPHKPSLVLNELPYELLQQISDILLSDKHDLVKLICVCQRWQMRSMPLFARHSAPDSCRSWQPPSYITL